MTTRADTHTTGTFPVKRGLAEMLKGGVIMDVVTPEQARIAEDAGVSDRTTFLGSVEDDNLVAL